MLVAVAAVAMAPTTEAGKPATPHRKAADSAARHTLPATGDLTDADLPKLSLAAPRRAQDPFTNVSAPSSNSQRTIANPHWISRPNRDDISRYYPERAQRTETEGAARMSCLFTAKGTLAACSVLDETPAGMGFGDAALKMSKLFAVRPLMPDGSPVEGARVDVSISFNFSREEKFWAAHPPPDE